VNLFGPSTLQTAPKIDSRRAGALLGVLALLILKIHLLFSGVRVRESTCAAAELCVICSRWTPRARGGKQMTSKVKNGSGPPPPPEHFLSQGILSPLLL